MKPIPSAPLNRRDFLRALLAGPVAYVLAACGIRPAADSSPTRAAAATAGSTPEPASPLPTAAPAEPTPTLAAQALLPTPACGDDDDVTPAQAAGPFYTPNSPERTSLLEPGLAGSQMVVAGQVLSTKCEPISGALLDFWHADDAGAYDNVGYRLRGHQFADDQGRYRLETILPGLYPGRTRHIHVRVQASNQPILTTQLYFPDEPANASDRIFNQALVMDVQDDAGARTASFNFVLDVG